MTLYIQATKDDIKVNIDTLVNLPVYLDTELTLISWDVGYSRFNEAVLAEELGLEATYYDRVEMLTQISQELAAYSKEGYTFKFITLSN